MALLQHIPDGAPRLSERPAPGPLQVVLVSTLHHEFIGVVDREDRRIADVCIEFVRRVDTLGRAKADVWQVHQHHRQLFLRDLLMIGNVEDFEYFLV